MATTVYRPVELFHEYVAAVLSNLLEASFSQDGHKFARPYRR
jgi:hypothetical protein